MIRTALFSAVTLLAGGLTGCKEDRETPAAASAPAATEEKLAQRAVEEPRPARALTPPDGGLVRADGIGIRIGQLRVLQTIEGKKTRITSSDTFLVAELLIRNAGQHEAAVDLTLATVKSPSGMSAGIARDAQVLAGRRELAFVVNPEQSVRAEVFFELPQEEIREGLLLVLPDAAGGEDEVLALQ